MTGSFDAIEQTCLAILHAVDEEAKVDSNPILIRIQYVVMEIRAHFREVLAGDNHLAQRKYHWSVLYRAGDTLNEMTILLKNTTPVFIENEVYFIMQQLVFYTHDVIQSFGGKESLYIITPMFQEMAGIWR
jgi:hypothetical protein